MSGGRREGAGRKPSPDKKVMVTVRLPPWLIAWLRAQPQSQAVLIEEALCRRHKLKSPERAG